jgi:hypothetical protein
VQFGPTGASRTHSDDRISTITKNQASARGPREAVDRTRGGAHGRYDALVSINVPNDKARAVVDAMERDMGTTLATKADLQTLRQEMELIRKDMQILGTSITVRLGSIIALGLAMLFAALKLTS